MQFVFSFSLQSRKVLGYVFEAGHVAPTAATTYTWLGNHHKALNLLIYFKTHVVLKKGSKCPFYVAKTFLKFYRIGIGGSRALPIHSRPRSDLKSKFPEDWSD